MVRCHSQYHPQVPTTTVSLMLVWCHQCAAWQRYYTVHTRYTDDSYQGLEDDDMTYGPFDSVGQVLDDATSSLTGTLLSAGRPWDGGPWGTALVERLQEERQGEQERRDTPGD